jgi:hypothetical protein
LPQNTEVQEYKVKSLGYKLICGFEILYKELQTNKKKKANKKGNTNNENDEVYETKIIIYTI